MPTKYTSLSFFFLFLFLIHRLLRRLENERKEDLEREDKDLETFARPVQHFLKRS